MVWWVSWCGKEEKQVYFGRLKLPTRLACPKVPEVVYIIVIGAALSLLAFRVLCVHTTISIYSK